MYISQTARIGPLVCATDVVHGHQTLLRFLPHDAYVTYVNTALYSVALFLSVCSSTTGIISKRLGRLTWFSAQRLTSAHAAFTFKGISKKDGRWRRLDLGAYAFVAETSLPAVWIVYQTRFSWQWNGLQTVSWNQTAWQIMFTFGNWNWQSLFTVQNLD